MKRLTLLALGLTIAYAPFSIAATATATTSPAATTTASASSGSAGTTAATADKTKPPVDLNQPADMDKVSYGIGVDLGENFKSENIQIKPEMLLKGMQDAIAGGKLIYTKDELSAALIVFQHQIIAKRQADQTALAAKNEKEGNDFLAANKSKPGVITTASGLQYKVVNQGSGTHPTDSDAVTVDYEGKLLNGQVFDSSYKRGKPVTFTVSEVIPGWVEAVKLMQPGATYEVYVPYKLAYGERGLGNLIGPKQLLIFKIHLVSVKPAS